jgi:hypothetical protein
MSRILVAATVPAFAMGTPDWGWWINNGDAITAAAAAAGHEADWHAVFQEDARGRSIFTPLRDLADERLSFLTTAWFSFDLGSEQWDSDTRLAGIVTGRNLIIDHALRNGHDWIYFADSDIEAPDDVLVRLLELEYSVVGAHVPTYGLSGPQAAKDWRQRIRDAGEHGDVQVHWNTAGSLLVHRNVFRRVPWRIDPDAGDTDDPATQHEMERLGYPTLVRHDVICKHHPEAIGAFENRGLDRTVYR